MTGSDSGKRTAKAQPAGPAVTAEPGPAPPRRRRLFDLNLRTKALVFSAALVVGSVTLGGIAVWWYMAGELILREQERLSEAGHDAGLQLNSIVGTVKQDALMIAGAPAVQGLIRAAERGDTDRDVEGSRGFWTIRTAALLKSLLEAKPVFREARLFQGDIAYQEILRVERDGDSFVVGLDNQVPALNDPPDFREVFRPGSGAVIVSDIEPNRQQGRVEMPLRPIIHIIAPIRDSTNLPFGFIVFTVDLSTFLADIRRFAPPLAQVQALNGRGQFMAHPDPAMIFSPTVRIEDEYPGFGAAFGTGPLQRAHQLLQDRRGEYQVLGVHDTVLGSGPAAHRIRFLYTARYADIRDRALVGNWRVIISCVLAMALALPLALIFGTALVRPIRRMTTFITSWTPGTAFTDLPTDRTDEIGVLAREFSRLLVSLEERQTTLQQEIDERQYMIMALEHAADSVHILDCNGFLLYVNRTWEQRYGQRLADVVGKRPSSRQFMELKGKALRDMIATTQKGDAWSGALQRKTPDGEIREDEVTISPVRNAAGQLMSFVVIGRDITEKTALESQLQRAQKLESIGQLAAGIAHEINTPTQYVGDNIRFIQDAFTELNVLLGKLTALSGGSGGGAVSAETLAQALGSADLEFLREEVPKALEQSADGCQRISGIVRAMKDFSHPGQDKTPLDLNRAIASTITVAANEWKYVAEMQTDFDAQLPPVVCLPGEFNQVILNMLVNAAHAIADVVGNGDRSKGLITVATRQEGEWVEIRIGDTGAGIPPEIREKIFDPFFTTKEVGKGTGQGLAIAHDVIVNKHGGSITLESEPGKGSTFIIRLPLASDSSDAAIAA